MGQHVFCSMFSCFHWPIEWNRLKLSCGKTQSIEHDINWMHVYWEIARSKFGIWNWVCLASSHSPSACLFISNIQMYKHWEFDWHLNRPCHPHFIHKYTRMECATHSTVCMAYDNNNHIFMNTVQSSTTYTYKYAYNEKLNSNGWIAKAFHMQRKCSIQQ